MEIETIPIEGCFLVKPKKIIDQRGFFVKIYHEETFTKYGIALDIQEEYYSLSNKNVVRGMHFQIPPEDHDKLVYCLNGEVLDVILDIRPTSKTYGEHYSIKLNSENSYALLLAKGIAHGFLSLKDKSIMVYKTSTMHNPLLDSGIHWKSFGFEWPVSSPIISLKDQNLPVFNINI